MSWRYVMKSGSKGEDVKELQQKLAEQGYYKGAIDGMYGPLTKAAVTNYQKDKNLIVDGMAGPQTQGSINSTPKQDVATNPAKPDPKKASGDPQYIFPDEYTIEEIQAHLDTLYGVAKKLVKARAEKTKKIIDDAEDTIRKMYIQEGGGMGGEL